MTGSINTTQKFAAGLLVNAYGFCSFYNCRVSMTISSSIDSSDGDGTHGGLVSYTGPGSTVTITGCLVDGSFLGTNTTLSGGFVGYCRGSLTVRDSIFAPTAWEWGSSENFYRWNGDYNRVLVNCYYLTPAANDQGSRGYAIKPDVDVAFTQAGGTEYDVAGLYATNVGIHYNGSLWAAEGETVHVQPCYAGTEPDEAEDFFLASAGTFTASNDGYDLLMPAEDVTITIGTHDWGAPRYEWSGDNSSVTAVRVCAHNPKHRETETVATTSQKTRPETCTEKGETTYTAEFTNKAFGKRTKTVADVAALGHDWNEPTYTWADDYSTITAEAVCSRNDDHHIWETVNAEYILTKPSTYKEEGIATYRATFKNTLFSQQTVQVAIPAIYCDGGENCPSSHFTDIPKKGYWAHMFVDWAVVNKVTAGTSATTFGPDVVCTRSQFVMLLWRTKGSPEPQTTQNPFKDVKKKDYFYKAVLWAVENGITGGTSATTFGSNDPCTRAQIVMFLWRMEGSEEPTVSQNPFTDVKKKDFYYKAVLWAVEKGITGGTSATTFTPKRVCTRVEAVTFLYREYAK